MLAIPLVLATAGLAAAAPSGDEPPSTPVPITIPDGEIMSYAVNIKQGKFWQIKNVERQIASAGGTVVQSWRQIGVVIAHSTDADFLSNLGAGAGSSPIESAGLTRTAPVVEGTPGEEGTARAATKRKASNEASARIAEGGRMAGTEEDPYESLQWGNIAIGADQANAIEPGKRWIVVGINDSGIEATHPDLAANLAPNMSRNCTNAGVPEKTGWQATTSAHGTHVAGIVAAPRNDVGIVGVAPNIRLASYKVVNDQGYIFPEYAICGIVTATWIGVKITNHSYYVDPWMFWCEDQPEQAAAKEAVRRAFAFADRKGVLSIAAAGNADYDLANKTTDDSSPNDSTAVDRTINSGCHDIPTELDGVVTVSSTQDDGAKSSFSNYGEGVIDVAAPGSRIPSTYTGHGYAFLSGTSMAAPAATGVAALLKSTYPKATDEQLAAMLAQQATDTPCPTGDAECTGTDANNGYFGDGLVDALAAVNPPR